VLTFDALSSLDLHALLNLAEQARQLRDAAGGLTATLDAALAAVQDRIADALMRITAPSAASSTLVVAVPEAQERANAVAWVTPGDHDFVAPGPDGAIAQGDTLAEVLRNLAEAVEISAEPYVAKVGDVIHKWSAVPLGTLAADGEGEIEQKRMDTLECYWWQRHDGVRVTGSLYPASDDEAADTGPWTILALNISDDVTGDEVARLVGDAT
jgi:hypothetical protein